MQSKLPPAAANTQRRADNLLKTIDERCPRRRISELSLLCTKSLRAKSVSIQRFQGGGGS